MSVVQLFIEVHCEELPAGWGAPAQKVFAKNIQKLLKGIPHGRVRTWHSTRRLAVAVDDVAIAKPKVEQVVTGPPWAVAWRDGAWTKAAQGFARGRKASVDDLYEHQGPRGSVVALKVIQGGEATADTVAAGLEQAILNIPFRKTLRWGSRPERWARPIHGVCAVLGGERVVATVAGLATRTTSVGHRRYRTPFVVTSAEDWLEELRAHYVIADANERKATIDDGLQKAAAERGVVIDPDPDLLDEVSDLVEWPVAVAGALPQHLMHLPPRLLIESMRVHQRIFDTQTEAGELSPVFITVSNNPDGDADIISAGNTRVLTARFEDARFFYDEDRKLTLDETATELERMRWVRGLGTMAEKAARVAALGQQLCAVVPDADAAATGRAGALCKADLCTHMVGEFPELQGHVGMLYARHGGEEEAVAKAIEEHYLPRFAGDGLPATPAGRALALADRLDTLAGCFSIGMVPKGSADPQGLRRAANGVIVILRDMGVPVDLGWLAEQALAPFGDRARKSIAELRDDLLVWFRARLRAQLLEEYPTEVVDAVLEAGGDCAVRVPLRVSALAALAASPDFGPLRGTFRRVMGLSKDHDDPSFDPAVLTNPFEQTLVDALQGVSERAEASMAQLDYATTLEVMAELRVPVDELFDEGPMVMCEDLEVRAHRLGLLRSVADLFRSVADFTRLSAEG